MLYKTLDTLFAALIEVVMLKAMPQNIAVSRSWEQSPVNNQQEARVLSTKIVKKSFQEPEKV